MIDPERPPLDPLTFEEIRAALHAIDQHHWPLLIEMQVPNFHPPNVPVPPQRSIHFRNTVLAYAVALFEIEAARYDQFRADFRYPPWLSRLADRVINRVLVALDKIEQGNPEATLWYHGVSQDEISQKMRERLWHATNRRIQEATASPVKPAEQLTTKEQKPNPETAIPSPSSPAKGKRLSSQIHSPSGALKMQAYMNRKGLNQTEFSIQAATSDKSIRKFIKTGMVKRSILISIAAAMGLSKEDLLS